MRKLVVFIFGCAYVYGLYRIRLGIGLTDEGFYLATPMRYALGDLPFRDEFFNPHRMFDIVLWPLFRLFPDISVYQLRLLWLTVQSGCVIALYAVFSRFAPGVLVALACTACIYLGNMIWTPGYHLMGGFLFVLAWSSWLVACLSSRLPIQVALGAGSGVAFFLAALSYLPLLAVEVVPSLLLVAQALRRQRSGGRTIATASHLGLVLVLALAAALVFARYDLLGHWWSAHTTMLSNPRYESSLSEKISMFLDQTAPHLAILAVVPATVLGALAFSRGWTRRRRIAQSRTAFAALSLVSAGLLLALIPWPNSPPILFLRPPGYTRPLVLVLLAVGLHLGALVASPQRTGAGRDADWRLVYPSVLTGSIILALLFGVLSDMAFKTMFAMVPLFVSGIVVVYRRMLGCQLGRVSKEQACLFAGAMCLVVGIGSYYAKPIYGDRAPFTGEFSHPRLAGIRSFPEKVEDLEGVAGYLSARLAEGDFLLVYDDAPLLYYVTGTRPAIDHAWANRLVPDATRRRSVERMITAGRIPEYAVRHVFRGPSPTRDPIHEFVSEHYAPETRFGVFEVWKLSEDPRAGASRR